jgi:hypothetical protein
MAGGTADDFWRDQADRIRTHGRPGEANVEGDLRRLAAAERYERLYSAAVQMLTTQGRSGVDEWPSQRRQHWHDLETLLTTGRSDPPGATADPAWQLASRSDATGRPVAIADAVHEWAGRLAPRPLKLDYTDLDDTDPDGIDLDGIDLDGHEPARTVVAVPGLTYTIVTRLLDELVQRMAPGRPIGAVGDGGLDLAAVVQGLADQLRAAVGSAQPEPRHGRGEYPQRLAGDPESAGPAGSRPALRTPQALAAGLALPTALENLTAAARNAAESVPTPKQLTASGDFSVRHAAAVAAADLLAGLRTPAGPRWRERHEGIRPDLHVITDFRFDGPAGRPVGLAERAAEIQTALRGLTPPWRPGPQRPMPESTPQTGWIALPDAAALVTAELLDELVVRLRPGRWIGTIRIGAWPLRDFVQSRLRIQAIAI